jgi:phosphatidylglycerophosphatase A
LGDGFFPFASGTAASAFALALYAIVPGFAASGVAAACAIVVLAALSIPAATAAEREFGHDGSPIVVDEIVGQWIAIAGLAATPAALAAAFVFFRAFDIVKPFPAGRSQHLPGGWGVLADDVVAGIYAAIATRLVLHFTGWGG